MFGLKSCRCFIIQAEVRLEFTHSLLGADGATLPCSIPCNHTRVSQMEENSIQSEATEEKFLTGRG